MKNFIADDEGYLLFITFSELEFSVENICSYGDVQSFYKEKVQEKKMLILSDFIYRYISADSPMELNLTANAILQLKDNFNKGICDDLIFHKIEAEIMTNLSDTWARFTFTSYYETYQKRKKICERFIELKI